MLSFWGKANHEQDVTVFNPRYDRGSNIQTQENREEAEVIGTQEIEK